MNKKVLSQLSELISPSKRELLELISSERTKYLTVVLEDIVKEFNSSAVLRSCDCFGVQELNIIAENQEFEIQRDIAKGASNWVDVNTYSGNNSPGIHCINELKNKGFRIIATSPHAEKTINDISIDQPIALVFGTERDGISENIISNADELVKIPMYGFTESFNISVSAALILNQLRNRLETSDLQWKLTEEEQTILKIKWCSKIIRNGEQVEAEIRRRILEKE
ncbi:MAG: RNA methyltransferase [Crocinitomicaceae bacterium]|nr:RNA methyltransferase [Flavobacteriales bacterium]NQZ35201.1 RNA methyltransferase [Crocinitomicaceae bacterium]PHR33267.1 MAG: rRNA methyltransferase [Fluviicola sp.]